MKIGPPLRGIGYGILGLAGIYELQAGQWLQSLGLAVLVAAGLVIESRSKPR